MGQKLTLEILLDELRDEATKLLDETKKEDVRLIAKDNITQQEMDAQDARVIRCEVLLQIARRINDGFK